MKKSILSFALVLISFNLFACHLISPGVCGDEVYVKTQLFDNNATFEFRYYGADTIFMTYHTKAVGNTDTTFTLPQTISDYPRRIQFRYKVGNGQFTSWGNNGAVPNYFQTSTCILPGCSVMAVSFTGLAAIRSNGQIQVTFANQDESGVPQYDIYMSPDAATWTKIKSVPNTGAGTYSISLTGAGMATAAGLMFILLSVSKGNKWRARLMFILFLAAVLWSCQKEKIATERQAAYKYVMVKAPTLDGKTTSTPVITIVNK